MSEKFVRVETEKLLFETGPDYKNHCVYCGRITKTKSEGSYHSNNYEEYSVCDCSWSFEAESFAQNILKLQRAIGEVEQARKKLKEKSPGYKFIRGRKMKEEMSKVAEKYGFRIDDCTTTDEYPQT